MNPKQALFLQFLSYFVFFCLSSNYVCKSHLLLLDEDLLDQPEKCKIVEQCSVINFISSSLLLLMTPVSLTVDVIARPSIWSAWHPVFTLIKDLLRLDFRIQSTRITSKDISS